MTINLDDVTINLDEETIKRGDVTIKQDDVTINRDVYRILDEERRFQDKMIVINGGSKQKMDEQEKPLKHLLQGL